MAEELFLLRTLARAGALRPGRPDRTLRALLALHRWGPTLVAGYTGCAARYPDAAAIIDELGSLSFGALELRTNALARGLSRSGVREHETVAIMCRNHRGFIEASIACAKLGAHALYLNTAFAGPQVSEVLERERPVALVYDQEFTDAVEDSCAGRAAFVAWVDDRPRAAHPSLQDLIGQNEQTSLTPPSSPGRTIILTSGTTGTPKGANRESPSSLQPAAALLSRIPLRARERTLISAPLFHSWGFAHMLLSTALASTVLLRRRFDPQDALLTIGEQRATALVVVPVMLQRILDLGEDARARYDTSSLSVIAASGSALSGQLAARTMQALGEKLYNLYGSTEVAWASIATPEELRAAPGTVGRPPRGTVVKILDEELRELPAGDRGRIFVGSELLFEGYTGGGDKERLGTLMSTGDIGHFDRHGLLFVDGRDDDMIVSGGENVFPDEVEQLLATFPGVADVAVVGVPDEEFGQRLRAFVVAAQGASLTEQALRDHVRSNLARYKVPRDVVFVDELPRNATGKVLRRELQAREDPAARG